MQGRRRIVSIEGNIGSGKSTILAAIAAGVSRSDIDIQLEPVDVWTRPSAEHPGGMLQAFYGDPTSNGFAFQMFVLLTRVQQAERFAETGTVLTERCILSDFELFAKLGRRRGLINDCQWAAYMAWFEHSVSRIEVARPDVIVYLRCDPAVCEARVKRRGRSAEAGGVDADYLHELHEVHEDWVARMQIEGTRDVRIVDVSTDPPDVIARSILSLLT